MFTLQQLNLAFYLYTKSIYFEIRIENDDDNDDDDIVDVQVCEDYEDDEREKFSEDLAGIKKRFSHTKVKRKWVSKMVF